MVSGRNVDGTALTFQHQVSDSLLKATATFKQVISCPELSFSEFEQQVKPTLWADQFGRLRIWAANIGAHQRGNTSLDFRLRDASHILDQVVELLDDLGDLLQDVLDLLRHVQEDETHDEPLETDLFDGDDSEYQELLSSVVLRIDCLFDMSVAIRKPAKLDRLIGIKKAQWGPYSQYDLQHVESKFPRSSRDLSEKLSAALTLRRGVLKYYETHRQKYASGINRIFEDGEGESVAKSHIESSVAPATEYNSHNFDTRSISGQSNRSMGSLIAADRPLHIPVPSNLFERKPFECPYCHYLLDTYNVRDFVRHVFDDITPYQCIFPNCLQSQNLIASRSAWIEHLTSLHKQQWLEYSHKPCFMCGQAEYSEKSFEKHIARHLEDLAIFALPALDDEEDDDANEDRQDSEHADSVGSESSLEPFRPTDEVVEDVPEIDAGIARDDSDQPKIAPTLVLDTGPLPKLPELPQVDSPQSTQHGPSDPTISDLPHANPITVIRRNAAVEASTPHPEGIKRQDYFVPKTDESQPRSESIVISPGTQTPGSHDEFLEKPVPAPSKSSASNEAAQPPITELTTEPQEKSLTTKDVDTEGDPNSSLTGRDPPAALTKEEREERQRILAEFEQERLDKVKAREAAADKILQDTVQEQFKEAGK